MSWRIMFLLFLSLKKMIKFICTTTKLNIYFKTSFVQVKVLSFELECLFLKKFQVIESKNLL